MVQIFFKDVRLAFNSGERAYILNQRSEAVFPTEEEFIEKKKKSDICLINFIYAISWKNLDYM